jgi:geranylgeranyl diphosphate synthase type II
MNPRTGSAGVANLDERFARWRREVDAALDRFLPAASETPSTLHDAMRYAVFGGGKRLRPLCCLLACEAAGGEAAAAMPAACALELVHTYSLVHDDLPCMDDDDYRRGRLTVHKVYGEAMGVLAGDALLTLAFSTVADGLAPAAAARACSVLAKGSGSLGMVGGQVGDLEAEGKTLQIDAILAIDSRKTAALFAAAFRMGAICAGAPRETEDRLERIGEHLGIAFQIVDDLLDVTASAETMGKATGKDAARGKATTPALLGLDGARRLAEEHSSAARGLASSLERGGLIEALIETMLLRTH